MPQARPAKRIRSKTEDSYRQTKAKTPKSQEAQYSERKDYLGVMTPPDFSASVIDSLFIFIAG